MALVKRRTHKDEPVVKSSKKERETWKLMELIPNGTKYTAYQRLDALTAYMTTGSIRKVEELTTIPYKTLHAWKSKSRWWEAALREMRMQKNDELDALITGTMHRAVAEINERLDKGDEVVLKDGTIVRKKVNLRDIAVGALAIMFDKRQLVRGQATQRIEQVTDDQKLQELKETFKRLATGPNAIEGQVISKETTEDNTDAEE